MERRRLNISGKIIRETFQVARDRRIVGPGPLRTIEVEGAARVALIKYVEPRAPIFAAKTVLMPPGRVCQRIGEMPRRVDAAQRRCEAYGIES